MNSFPVYILTLETRLDRQDRIKKGLDELSVNHEFIYSNKSENQNFCALPMSSQTEVAIWNSHIRAMNRFLQTNSAWTMILEDDAIVQGVSRDFFQKKIPRIISIFEKDFGIVQIGWIPNSENGVLRKITAKIFRSIFGANRFDLKSKVKYIIKFGLKNYRRASRDILETTGERLIPLYGMRLGAHAYLINRETSTKLINRFEERHEICDFKTIDQDLLHLTGSLNGTQTIRAVRFNKNFVQQSQVDSDNLNKTVY
jgi:GR25 family glycosyltransferase involved in LPS biosynthesis